MKETYEDFLQLLKASINKSEVKINNVNWQSILQLSKSTSASLRSFVQKLRI